MYKPFEITDRIKKVKEIYKKSPIATEKRPFYYSGDRWQSLYFLRGWVKFKDEDTMTLRRAKAEAYILQCSRPIINDGELIVGQLDFHKYSGAEQAEFDALLKSFNDMSPNISWAGRTDHLALDYEKLLNVGVNGLVAEINKELDALTFSAETIARDVEKEVFYRGALCELNALLELAEKYAAEAERLAEKASGKRKAELAAIAENMRTVPAKPAKTFWQALQSIHFYTFNLFGLYPCGRPDLYLIEYYENDLNSGILSREFAQELLDNYCLTFTTYNFSSASNGFMIGGSDKDGNPVENELTYMLLTSGEHIRMPDPNIGLCVTSNTSEELILYAARILSEGCTQPAFYNDEKIVKTLMSQGVCAPDARSYINTTCVEISIAGKSNMWTTCPYINIAVPITELLSAENRFETFEELFSCYMEKVKKLFKEGSINMARLQMERTKTGAMPLRASCLVDNCIKEGKSLDCGGAVYNRVYPTILGFANAVDSLAAIKNLVFDSGKLSFAELADIVNSDYDGHEELRRYIVNKLPHYGNDNAECDKIAGEITEITAEYCKTLGTYRKDITVPGIFSFNVHMISGKTTKATPDGRKSGAPLADSCGPVQGHDTSGPTSMLNSVTSWNDSAYLGGIALNMKFNKNYVKPEIIAALLKTYFANGGIQVQLNCVDKKELEDARDNPEAHRDLVVRIGGYSDYFVKLSPEIMQEIIDRTEN